MPTRYICDRPVEGHGPEFQDGLCNHDVLLSTHLVAY